jgi:hypothetical protein
VAKEVFDHYFDQPLDPYSITYKNDTYGKLGVDSYFMEVFTRLHPAYPTTTSNVIFLSLSSRAARHCGVMKIVFSGVIDTNGIHSRRKSEIGKLTTTIYIPLFY